MEYDGSVHAGEATSLHSQAMDLMCPTPIIQARVRFLSHTVSNLDQPPWSDSGTGSLSLTTDPDREGERVSQQASPRGTFLTQLRRVRVDDTFLSHEPSNVEFTEECLAAILAIRSRDVRQRLTSSIDIIANAQRSAWMPGADCHVPDAHRVAFRDVRVCLEARLDQKRLPKPHPDWIAASKHLIGFLGSLAEELEAAERQADAERDESLDRMHPF